MSYSVKTDKRFNKPHRILNGKGKVVAASTSKAKAKRSAQYRENYGKG